MPRVAIYARVSTSDQNAEMQVTELRTCATSRGWQIVEEYVDEGVSGAQASRPALDRLMADARRRRFDIVLCWRFDRFARSTQHLLMALEQFRSVNIDFVSLHEAVDTTTPLGRMVFTVVAAVAELERSIIGERVRAGVARARSQGKRLGRPATGTADISDILGLQAKGLRQHQIAEQLGVSRAFVSRQLALHKTYPKLVS